MTYPTTSFGNVPALATCVAGKLLELVANELVANENSHRGFRTSNNAHRTVLLERRMKFSQTEFGQLISVNHYFGARINQREEYVAEGERMAKSVVIVAI